ncbi:endoribonuclease Arlr [Halictus rubicundus]|uniref:endoribonuclease Arlr n=1 Tax=Halictus rubicundus TaxID=77578 RepID=UPI00403519AD
MRFQTFLFLLLILAAIDTIAARKSRHKPNSHGGSKGSKGNHTQHQKSKNSNTDFLNSERSGATRPAGKPDNKTGTVTKSKQGTSHYEPSAPTETHSDQGSNSSTHYGPWSNPHIDSNQPKAPSQTHPPGSNTHGGTNQPSATVNGGGDTASTGTSTIEQTIVHHHHHHHHHHYDRQHATQSNQTATNKTNSPAGPCIVNNSFFNISDNDIFNITEQLFAMSLDISKYIQLDLQIRSTSPNATNEAKNPLFQIDPILLNYPSIHITHTLYDKHGPDFRDQVNLTQEIREHENLLIDTYLNTSVMAKAMKWLSDRKFIGPDDFERKDVLRRIWFTIYGGSTCGFEQIFESEKYDQEFVGVRDWLYFANKESSRRIDYMSYVDQLKLGTTASLLKLNFAMDGIVKQNETIFVGTMPELEMALYTICFYARTNSLCSISLGGTRSTVYTHSLMYSPGSLVLDAGFPLF